MGIHKDTSNRKRGNVTCAQEVPFDGEEETKALENRKATYVKVSDIDDTEDGNPRKITKKNLERLKQSIQDNRTFFEARPVLLNRMGGGLKIIGGHQRLKAAKALGMNEVPAFIFDGLDEDTAKRYTLLDNTNEGAWDFKKLTEFAADIDLGDFNVQIPESVDYNRILAENVLEAIIYKPSEEKAEIKDFLDNELYDIVSDEVSKMVLPDELKEFVNIRLQWFRRFRFDKIADYYARADERTKRLFRQLALVFDITGTTFERDLLDFYKIGLEPDAYE